MLKETETEETIVFFVTFLSLVAFQLGGRAPLPPHLATPMLYAYNFIIQEVCVANLRDPRHLKKITDES